MRIVLILALSACLGACGDPPSLRTLTASCTLAADRLRLNIGLPRGDITVVADGAAGSRDATGTLEIFDLGLFGLTSDPANPDDITFALSASGSLRATYGSEADKLNLSYALTLHVPSDYQFWSEGALTANRIETGAGEILVRGLKGGDMGHRDFDVVAGAPINNLDHPSMTIEDVDGMIFAQSWGPTTVTGCRAVASVLCGGSRDQLTVRLGTVAFTEAALIEGEGRVVIELSRQSNFRFLNEIGEIGLFAIRGVKNKGGPVIQGPTDVVEDFLPYQLIQTGDGMVGTFKVHTVDNVIEYSLYD